METAEAEKNARLLKRERIRRFLDQLREQDGLIIEFDEGIFHSLTERLTVKSKQDITVRFRDGGEIRVDITEQ